jgi:hypothetical protein
VDTLFYISAAGIGAGVAAGVARRAWQRRDAARRDAEREAYRLRRQEQQFDREAADVAAIVDRYYPFVKPAWSALPRTVNGRERLRVALAGVDGLSLGAADIGFDAVRPTSADAKGLCVLGKTGSGKTVIANHLIRRAVRSGHAVAIVSSEAEHPRDHVLPMVPRERAADVVFFKPADPACTLTWNPLAIEDGDDQAVAAGELFSIFKRAIGEASIGARADTILSAAFGVLFGRSGATLWSVIRLLEDEAYRTAVVAEVDDPYLREFWTKTFPEYPSGATLPLLNRLHQFLRLPQLRAALCNPVSSISIREALAKGRILIFDLSGLDPDAIRLVGQMLLSKFQLELMRRERVREEDRRPVHVFLDEFHVFATASEGTFRELLARGRRYGLALYLFTQHPNQLPRTLQQEIFGNVASLIALCLSAADAATLRREFLISTADGGVKPVAAEELVSLPVGEGFVRLVGGACALRVKFTSPIERGDPRWGDRVRQISWKTYAAPPMPKEELVAATQLAPGATPTVPTATPGRGSAPHKMIQRLAKEWSEARGFRASLEQDVLGGTGRVDVVLERADLRIALEVAVANSPAEVAETIVKDVAAGFDNVVVVSNDGELLRRSEERIKGIVPAKASGKVHFLSPDALPAFLDGFGAADPGTRAGYRVRVEGAPEAGRRRSLARLVGAALLRRRRSS